MGVGSADKTKQERELSIAEATMKAYKYQGVCVHKPTSRFRSIIRDNDANKTLHLGMFNKVNAALYVLFAPTTISESM